MKVDIGFWDINGNYIPDIQEVSEVEMDKEFFNDIDNMVKVNKLEQENAELKQTLQEIKAIAEEWINNDWSCFHCRTNMDEKLKEILDLITKAESEG